jgi:very-short-patch-repair endonuclease
MARDRAALRAGWRIVRVTWSDMDQRPDEVFSTIARLTVS